MNVWTTAVAILVPFAAMWFLLRAVQRESGIAAGIERVGAALALSIGVTSVTFFFWRVMGGAVGRYQLVETALFALVAFAVVFRRVSTSSAASSRAPPEPKALRAVATGGLLILVVAFILFARMRFDALPHGEWDAWAMWNMRAAFVAAPTEHWSDGFTLALVYAPPDYPLLLPASIARLWALDGQWSTAAPVWFASLVGLATILLVTGSLLRITGILGAALGLAILLVPGYTWYVTSQCADTVLALFIVMTLTMLAAPENPGRLAVAGAAAGFAAWTKNEGLVAAIAMPTLLVIVSAPTTPRGTLVRRVAFLAAGLVPILAVLGFFKLTLAPPSELLTGIAQSGPIDKLLDVTRHKLVASYMLGHLAEWGRWSVTSPLWFALGWLALGAWNFRRVPVAAIVGAGTLVCMSMTYYLIYILTAHDLIWHLQTSWARLIAQMWPTLAWTAAAAALAPVIRPEGERASIP